MYAVLNCIVTQHDLRLVVLAAVICVLASFTAISLLPMCAGPAPIYGGSGLRFLRFRLALESGPCISLRCWHFLPEDYRTMCIAPRSDFRQLLVGLAA
jgi:hypothetical protein